MSDSCRLFGAGFAIGLLPCVLSLAIGLPGLPFGFSPVVPMRISLLFGLVMVFRVRTRSAGAGLVAGSVIAALLLPAVAIIAWLIDPTVVF